MWCAKCQHDLVDCTCPDLEERLARASRGGHFVTLFCKLCGLHKDRCRCEAPDLSTDLPKAAN